MSAGNRLSLAPEPVLGRLSEDPQIWAAFLDWEERFCAEPGALDGGTHLLFAATRPDSRPQTVERREARVKSLSNPPRRTPTTRRTA